MSWLAEVMLNVHNWWNDVPKVKARLRKDDNPLRIGVLSAAAISYNAIIDPIQTHPGAVLTAIASRDITKAQAQIDKYKLGPSCRAYGGYASLLEDPNIDAVYIPTPNGFHSEWAIKAMAAGKHVLVEKPIASNAGEVRKIQEAAARTGKVAVEAFHWRFHPAAHVVKSLIESGKYGYPTSTYAQLQIASGAFPKDDIRFNYALAGGACMDLTYVFSGSTYYAGPSVDRMNFEVLRAKPRTTALDARVDEAMEAEFVVTQPDNRPPVHCRIKCDASLPPFLGFIPRIWEMSPVVVIELEKAKITFDAFALPAYGHSIVVAEKDGSGKLTGKKEKQKLYHDGPHWGKRGEPWWTTYRYQLEAFVDMVKAKEAGKENDYAGPWVSLRDSEKLMELIDATYVKAGMTPRGA